MTFLDLVQEFHEVSGSPGNAPVSVLNQTGAAARAVRWISNADYHWQARWHNWNFLFAQTPAGMQVTPGANLIAPTDLHTWDRRTMFVRETGGDWVPLRHVEYAMVKSRPPVTETGFPYQVTVLPNNSLMFDPVPDGPYEFRSDYYKRPVRLRQNEDVSAIPEEYLGTVVVGTAILYYAQWEDAPEQRILGLGLVEQGRSQLEAHELPTNQSEWTMGDTFAVGESGF